MNTVGKIALLLLLTVGLTTGLSAQCKTWVDSPQKDAAENAHVTYRGYLKDKSVEDLAALSPADFKIAFDNWKKAYDIAPAADGQRPFHYQDGRKLYKAMREKETDDAKKAEYMKIILDLYEQEAACFKDTKAYLQGRKAYDQFYLGGYSVEALNAFEKAMDDAGNESEYIIFVPLGQLMTYLFESDQVQKERVQKIFEQATKIAEHNIKKGGPYKEYYESGKANMDASLVKVESEVFDCAYFKKSLMPAFEENKDSMNVVLYIYKKLLAQGCDSTEADVVRVRAQYDKLYETVAAEMEVERRRLNPGYDAQKMMDEGNMSGAIARYRDAISTADSDDTRGTYYYQIASIYNSMGQYSSALDYARKAASAKGGWGKPYIMIGDVYARMSRGCSDSWEQRLAILAAVEKYQYARSIDGSASGEANRRISNYSSSFPTTEDVFQRNMTVGQKVRSSCIGETVTIRTQ